MASISSSKETFFDAIVDERAWEFGGEMIRKYELIRWGIYSDKVKETVEGLKNLADRAFNGTGTGPDYIYWKVDENGDFIILNPDTKLPAPPDDTWNEDQFLLKLHDDVLTYDDWITGNWYNYYNGTKPGVARYIFPIPAKAISSSQGKLKNDGYDF
ncbi:RagB/SusD family nutrient uptake outer membrane protein [Thalassobellus suaedae]|uniref:RagB/SusD family nutrient uptake outer membrane protein n=1 Tax=Thalassobellus suaedae TaxID=3074124 RepID=A0ABY9Y9D1_9FLAO|nr:RagB/SusD family nutrient uptake outer membrane protein [Flavobacteriaceae bacterium HL-DH10]